MHLEGPLDHPPQDKGPCWPSSDSSSQLLGKKNLTFYLWTGNSVFVRKDQESRIPMSALLDRRISPETAWQARWITGMLQLRGGYCRGPAVSVLLTLSLPPLHFPSSFPCVCVCVVNHTFCCRGGSLLRFLLLLSAHLAMTNLPVGNDLSYLLFKLMEFPHLTPNRLSFKYCMLWL